MSYVIIDKHTRAAIFETFNASTAEKINLKKYAVLTALEYLGEFNKRLKTNDYGKN